MSMRVLVMFLVVCWVIGGLAIWVNLTYFPKAPARPVMTEGEIDERIRQIAREECERRFAPKPSCAGVDGYLD